jgi:hypothetical protein
VEEAPQEFVRSDESEKIQISVGHFPPIFPCKYFPSFAADGSHHPLACKQRNQVFVDMTVIAYYDSQQRLSDFHRFSGAHSIHDCRYTL